MLKDYCGDITVGRLRTTRFIGLWFLLVVLFFLFGVLVGASIGVAEHILGGDLQNTQQALREGLGLPAMTIVFIAFLVFAFAKLNIVAKRARDAGLPGWLTALVLAALSAGTTAVGGAEAAGGLGFLLLIVLAFLPTDVLRRTT
ncbi:MAG TPA: DUF805 domain-containing protein [Kiloniellaceae bacterium]|nr:DUF805 domain-containing protein [Kiloniellaceae bacterium]